MGDLSTYRAINISSNIRDYSAEFVESFELELERYAEGETFFIIDNNILKLYPNQFKETLKKFYVIGFDALETKKSLASATEIVVDLIERGFKKNFKLVGIGGGIVQDITGFVASILFRGVSWDLYPTTLLAQADSCIGSKTSINVFDFKNQLGTFFPPERIIVDSDFLETLAHSEILSGVGEMIKVHLLDSEESFDHMVANYSGLFENKGVMLDLIYRSLQIKKRVIEIDEFDRDYRNIMNYGHSFGHALESVTNYGIPHGQAVTVGMDMANYISFRMELIPEATFEKYGTLIRRNFPDYHLKSVDIGTLINSLSKDKKNVGKMLTLILTKGAGKMDKYLIESDDKFRAWIEDYFENYI
ncbi:MAG: hypothetical protein KDC83_13535 [Flavobacteriales bacterium]|nr:hypothetical protein [Flavobacteriales bacterium]